MTEQFFNQTNKNFSNTRNTIGQAVQNVTNTSLVGAETLLSIAFGGAAASNYNGSTALQETVRWARNAFNAPRSQFNLTSKFDFRRVGLTTAINTAAVYSAWNAGLYVGSMITTALQGLDCD